MHPVKSFTTREDAEAFAAGQEIPGDLAAKKVKGADKFYAVARGIQPGIYTEWTACQEAIEGAKGPKYKKFGTKAEAEDFIRLNGTAATVLGMGLAGNYDDPDAAYDEEDEQDDDEGVEVKQEVKKLEAAGVKVVSPSEAPPAGMGRDGVLRIYTDGSSRGNGKVGALAGVGVYFGKNDPRYVLPHVLFLLASLNSYQKSRRTSAGPAPNKSESRTDGHPASFANKRAESGRPDSDRQPVLHQLRHSMVQELAQEQLEDEERPSQESGSGGGHPREDRREDEAWSQDHF